jgi:regulatory protein
LAEKVAEQTFHSTDEIELIEAFLKRKFRGKQLGPFLKDPKNLAAAFRRLRYAGFSSGASIRVLKRYSSQAEELDGLEAEESES